MYNWRSIGQRKKTFPSTPVLYVKEPGMYKCLIECDVDKKLETDYIEVLLEHISKYNNS